MYALPKALDRYRSMVLPGELVYEDRTEQVPKGGVHQGLIRNLGALIKRVVADEPTARVPSAHECGSCAIAAAECPVRVDVQLDDEPQDPVQEPTSPVALPRSVSLPDRPPDQ